jgi:hypothetical protein
LQAIFAEVNNRAGGRAMFAGGLLLQPFQNHLLFWTSARQELRSTAVE